MFSANQIAQVCHEANRALQVVTGDRAVSPHWDDAPTWQRGSAMQGVDAAWEGATPQELHESWMQEKVAAGWAYGETKDGDAKTHPCLVPYEKLPEEQRRKDTLFRAIVNALS